MTDRQHLRAAVMTDHQYLRAAIVTVPPRRFRFFSHSLDDVDYTINYIFIFILLYSAYKNYRDPNSPRRRSRRRER